jgi:hypothetical protein
MREELQRAADMYRNVTGCSSDEVRAVADRYESYLHANRSGTGAAVDADVDFFWHLHVLDMPRYRAFCERDFGVVIDHQLPADPIALSDFGRALQGPAAQRGVGIEAAALASAQCSGPSK